MLTGTHKNVNKYSTADMKDKLSQGSLHTFYYKQ